MQAVSLTVAVGHDQRLPEAQARCRLVLRLDWSEADPLSVGLDLTAVPPHPALPSGGWAVLRDFLHYGLEEPTGDGAVRVRPGDAAGVVIVELPDGARGSLPLAAPASTLRAFIDCTHTIVPSGEVSPGSLDALIGRLLEA